MQLQEGKSYVWLCIAGAFVSGMSMFVDNYANDGKPAYSLLVPAVLVFALTVVELYSGLAMDYWWRATIRDESPVFWANILTQCLFTVGMVALSSWLLKHR